MPITQMNRDMEQVSQCVHNVLPLVHSCTYEYLIGGCKPKEHPTDLCDPRPDGDSGVRPREAPHSQTCPLHVEGSVDPGAGDGSVALIRGAGPQICLQSDDGAGVFREGRDVCLKSLGEARREAVPLRQQKLVVGLRVALWQVARLQPCDEKAMPSTKVHAARSEVSGSHQHVAPVVGHPNSIRQHRGTEWNSLEPGVVAVFCGAPLRVCGAVS
mmetsp:Transcript_39743/g.98362  ORF Transcript_39743/g.98362 Transcript_39743/m.98362 type:complete len:214 (-) Transcript_39743:890-1531(-)